MSKPVPLASLVSQSGVFTDGDWVESKDQDPDGDVRLIQLADIGVGEFLDKSSRYLTEEKANKLNCTYLEKGDILIARMPDPIGRACFFPGDEMKCVTVVDVCILRPNSKDVNNRWLLHYLNSEWFGFQISQMVTGATRQRISRGNLSKIPVQLPNPEEQESVATALDKIDFIRLKYREAELCARDLYWSLSQRKFKGEL